MEKRCLKTDACMFYGSSGLPLFKFLFCNSVNHLEELTPPVLCKERAVFHKKQLVFMVLFVNSFDLVFIRVSIRRHCDSINLSLPRRRPIAAVRKFKATETFWTSCAI